MTEWTASHVAEKGDKVKLLRPLGIWRYTDKVSWNVFKHSDTDTEDRTIDKDTIGEVCDRETFVGKTTYTVKFGDLMVGYISAFMLEKVEGK